MHWEWISFTTESITTASFPKLKLHVCEVISTFLICLPLRKVNWRISNKIITSRFTALYLVNVIFISCMSIHFFVNRIPTRYCRQQQPVDYPLEITLCKRRNLGVLKYLQSLMAQAEKNGNMWAASIHADRLKSDRFLAIAARIYKSQLEWFHA